MQIKIFSLSLLVYLESAKPAVVGLILLFLKASNELVSTLLS